MVIPEASLVWAMDPNDQSAVIPLMLHPLTEAKLIASGMRSAIGEYWCIIHGRPRLPDDIEGRNRFSPDSVESLRRPAAVFRGVKRPLHHVYGGADGDVYIYVSLPANTYQFIHHKDYGGVLQTLRAPVDSVFATYVSFSQAHVDGALQGMQRQHVSGNGIAPGGVVLGWEWTPASVSEGLPFDHANRYGTRVL